MLASAVRVAVRWQPNQALNELVAGAIAFLAADFAYGENLLQAEWRHIPVVFFGYSALMVLSGTAALAAARGRLDAPSQPAHQLGFRRMAILAIALLVGPTLLLVEATPGPVKAGVAIGLAGLSVGAIVLVRLWLSARSSRRRAVRERAFLTASRSLVEATTNAEVTAALRTALGRMLPPRTACAVQVGPIEIRPSIEDIEPTQFVVPIVRTVSPPLSKQPSPRDEIVFIAPSDELAELRPTLLALSNQAGAALDRIEMMRRLRAEERERYFRTLVLTSTDATLITRVGRIEYATPSARTIFGRDVLGGYFDDLVRRSSVDDPPDPRPWSDEEEAAEGYVQHADGRETPVVVHRRDLTTDPTVNGVVSTLRDVTAERELRRDLAYRASHDALTGLANAQAFGDELRREDAAARKLHDRRGRPGDGRAALFVDLDDFKNVNDTYGHQVGDQLLAEVGLRIRSCLRDNDVAARLGGDEFAVLLRDVGDERAAHAVAQRIVDALAEPIRVGGIPLTAHASVGLAYTSHLGDLDTLLRNADTALYTAKAHGKAQWWQYREGMTNPSRHNGDRRQRLEQALDHGHLSVHYQPIVELRTGITVGFEALVRFVDPRRPMSTTELIEIAEESGLISRIGEFVLRRALADAAEWDPDVFVSVNVSARQMQQPVFAETVDSELTTTGFDPARLVLEITETMPVDDDRSWTYLNRLRDRGVRVAIDDYGTGHASLTYLRQPIVDLVKIDKSFVDGLRTTRDRRLLQAITELCRDLGLDTIAEGVGDADRRDALIEAGCRYGQGFLFSPALPVDQAARWVAEHPLASRERT
jgi:diguanylate cyclase (GGDEF)-like protein/PAS domain S-box-containing protein